MNNFISSQILNDIKLKMIKINLKIIRIHSKNSDCKSCKIYKFFI